MERSSIVSGRRVFLISLVGIATLSAILATAAIAPVVVTGAVSPGLGSPQVALTTTGSSDWFTYLGNYNRTSNGTNDSWLTQQNAKSLGVSWTYTAGQTLPNGSAAVYNGIASSTTVVAGTAYFGSWNGFEYAVNVTTHHLVWSTYLGIDSFAPKCGPTNNIGVSSPPTVANGTVYLGGNNVTGGFDAAFYALNASNGTILWSVPTGNMTKGYYSWANPLIYDGYAYIGLASNCDGPLVQAGLLQINLQTNLTTPNHIVVHRFNTMPTVNGKEFIGASIWASPSLDAGNNTIYVTTGNPPAGTSTESPPNPQNYSESIIALNASTLNLESFWQIPQHETVSDGDFGAGATVVQGVPVKGSPETLVVAGNKDGFVYAWNASDVGRGPLWATQTGITIRELISPAAYGGGLVYVETPALTIGGVSAPGGIFALYPNNGTIAWEEALLGRGIGAPLYADGVILAEAGQFIEVFNGVNGQIDTEIKCPSYFVSAPSIAEGYVWAGCENGMEYALELSTHTYTVKFTETGLPLQSTWGITLAPYSGSPTVVNSTTTTSSSTNPTGCTPTALLRYPGTTSPRAPTPGPFW